MSQYGTTQYGTTEYGFSGTVFVKNLADSITPSDIVTKAISMPLADTIPSVDALVKELAKLNIDNIFGDDVLTKQITSKIIESDLRISVWLNINRDPAQSDWSDQ